MKLFMHLCVLQYLQWQTISESMKLKERKKKPFKKEERKKEKIVKNLYHKYATICPSKQQVQFRLLHLFGSWVDNKFTIDQANSDSSNWFGVGQFRKSSALLVKAMSKDSILLKSWKKNTHITCLIVTNTAIPAAVIAKESGECKPS